MNRKDTKMSRAKHDPTLRENIARNMKILLAARDMKPKDIAKRLNITPNAVGKWLRAETDMGLDGLERVAKILHTTPLKLVSTPEEVADNCTRLIC